MNSTQLDAAIAFFPMEKPRQPQVDAMDFITDAVNQGYQDIVVAAPTGIGKSGIGVATGLWASSFTIDNHKPGAYYLVTQKMLQNQLERDFPRFLPQFRTSAASLKSAIEYPCRSFGTCMAGSMAAQGNTKCPQRSVRTCPYACARGNFDMAKVAITNYPYLFTEHMYLNELKPRNFLIADECHTLEKQIIGFIEVVVNAETLDNWAPDCRPVPQIRYVEDFADWLSDRYIRTCQERLEMLNTNLAASGYTNRRMQEEFNRLKNYIGRMLYAIKNMKSTPHDWVYWQHRDQGEWHCTAKPLNAAPFVPNLIHEMGATRLYMSAYPGPKDVFCRNLGLNPQDVAWLELDSAFPAENRLIHMVTVGSMSKSWIEKTMPHLLKMCETILESHPNEKGIIHCHSYAIGKKIFDYFQTSPMRRRVLFPGKASERATNFNEHRISKIPTVMLSPSISEGFSFDDDLARFQIVAKVPYPYLGDLQVAEKLKQDRDWYTLQTVQTIIQACGRIVRSDTDHGTTYILDNDFMRLYEDNSKFFPKWFTDAFKFY